VPIEDTDHQRLCDFQTHSHCVVCAQNSQQILYIYLQYILYHILTTRTLLNCSEKGKGKVLPYSLPSVGPGADPGEQAVNPQVTSKAARTTRNTTKIKVLFQTLAHVK